MFAKKETRGGYDKESTDGFVGFDGKKTLPIITKVLIGIAILVTFLIIKRKK